MNFHPVKLGLYLLAVLALLAPAQLRAETPEEFSQVYLKEMRTNGLKGAASLLHPDEAKKLADLVIELTVLSEKSGEKLPFLGPDDTAASLRKLPPKELAVKFFGFVDQAAPQLGQLLKTAPAKSIGHVTDGDTIYVVTKLTFEMEGETITGTDILPLKKDGDSYKVLMKAEMTGILRAMKKQLSAK